MVEGGGDLESACLVVKGVATLEGQLEFKRCINSAEGKNNDEAGKGGALRAEQVKLQGAVWRLSCRLAMHFSGACLGQRVMATLCPARPSQVRGLLWAARRLGRTG